MQFFVGPDLAGEFKSIHPWHHHVADDKWEIRFRAVEYLQSLDSISSSRYSEIFPELSPQHFAYIVIVLYNQDVVIVHRFDCKLLIDTVESCGTQIISFVKGRIGVHEIWWLIYRLVNRELHFEDASARRIFLIGNLAVVNTYELLGQIQPYANALIGKFPGSIAFKQSGLLSFRDADSAVGHTDA